jgi:hypothetical protein
MGRATMAFAVLAAVPLIARAADAPITRAVIVAGLGGNEQYSRMLTDWAGRFHAVLTKQCSLKGEHVLLLTEAEDAKASPPRRKATTANVKAALGEMARALRPNDQFILVLLGHGQINEESGKLCLPGRDMTAGELGDLLDSLPAEQVVIVNAASGGADFLKAYLRAGRVIVTAAGYETEGTQTYFAEFFLRGYETGRADADRNRKIDLLEAYVYAARETANFYHRQYVVKRPDLGKGVKPTPGKVYWLVRGKETRGIWRKLYADTDNILARPQKQRNDEGKLTDDLPADLDAETDPRPAFGRYDKHWHNRRILAEHARLDDTGRSKQALFLWQPYKFLKPPTDTAPGQTGHLARHTVLGRPVVPAAGEAGAKTR